MNNNTNLTKKANPIRKAVTTYSIKNGGKKAKGIAFVVWEFFNQHTLNYFQKKYYSKFYKEHYDAVEDIINVYLGKEIRHVILQADCQSGKTTVMGLLYDIINERESSLARYLKIKMVIYLTGDNQVELSNHNMGEFREMGKMYDAPIRLSGSNACKPKEYPNKLKEWKEIDKTPFVMIRNSDCKKFREKVEGFTLDNTLIMVDESHYGTREMYSQLNKLFHSYGIDFSGDIKKLKKINSYILSVSATPYNEKYASKTSNEADLSKGIVHYKAGEGYAGFVKFNELNMVKGLNNNEIITDKDRFIDFLKAQRKKLDKIYKEKGEKHAVIMRMQGSKALISEKKLGEEELSRIASKYGFKLMAIDSKRGKIDYKNAYAEIDYNQDEKCRNILIIIKEAYSYGIVIPQKYKMLISTVYDFRPSELSDNTEQGLLGRMSGYYKNGLNKYLDIYISNDHLQSLINYSEGKIDMPKPIKVKGSTVKCSFEEWDNATYTPRKIRGVEVSLEDEKKFHIQCLNNSEGKPLVCKGKNVDDFFSKLTEEEFEKLSNPSTRGQFLKPIYVKFNKDVLDGRFDMKLVIDSRRQFGDDGMNNTICSKLGYSTPILSNTGKFDWRTVENAIFGKIGSAFIFDFRNAKGRKGIEVRVAYGPIGFTKDETEYKERPIYNGYQNFDNFKKSELALAMAAS